MRDALSRLSAALAHRYRLDVELGAGGMATVYRAHDLRHGRDVAIKVLRDDVAASVGRERFLREIQFAARLSHPHILPLFDSGEVDGALYYVMPVVAGASLRERLKSVGALPLPEAVRIATEVAEALQHAHVEGIVHRDIKPENILLQNGRVIVADFGIGKALSDLAGDTLTQVGVSVGTPAYLSPEQAVGEEVDGRSDLYSLGCVLYEMLVGEPPFTAPTVQAVIAKRFVQTPADVAALREGVPRAVARTVQKALARLPVDRYATAAEFLASLTEPESAPARASAPSTSLAILPFENLSADPDNTYFADGIADDILDSLVRVDGLHVAARQSAFSFRGKAATLAEIGEALHVGTVLQGSLRRSGNRMRLAVQLVSVADGYHLWSERFDREVVDVFAVQDEIAAAITSRLQLTFVPAAQPVARATTAEVEAFELVAKGRALSARRGRSLSPARSCFERAIALAPNDADAHFGLAEVLTAHVRYCLLTHAEGIRLARAAIDRGQMLAPAHPQGFAMRGLLTFQLEFDLDAAIGWWERALEQQPRLADIRAALAVQGLICGRGEIERGLREVDRACADDPCNALCAVNRSVAYSAGARPELASEEAARACALDPDAFLPLYARVGVLSRFDSHAAAAVDAARAAQSQIGRTEYLLGWLPRAYVALGARESAEAIYAELMARRRTDEVSSMMLGLAADGIGRVDDAIAHFADSIQRSDFTIPCWTLATYVSAELMAHPAYSSLLPASRIRTA